MSKYLSGEYKLRKSVVFRIMKSTMKRAAMRFRDIIDLNLERVSEESFWTEISYTYFYVNSKEILYARKSMLLINYIAVEYEGFSSELVQSFMSEIDKKVDNAEYSSYMKNVFLMCLGLNRKLPRELKLWLRLQ
jgi:hypothetical protein